MGGCGFYLASDGLFKRWRFDEVSEVSRYRNDKGRVVSAVALIFVIIASWQLLLTTSCNCSVNSIFPCLK